MCTGSLWVISEIFSSKYRLNLITSPFWVNFETEQDYYNEISQITNTSLSLCNLLIESPLSVTKKNSCIKL